MENEALNFYLILRFAYWRTLLLCIILLFILVPAIGGRLLKTTVGLNDMQATLKQIFGQGIAIIILGSLIAFLVGQVVDVVIFHGNKKKWRKIYLAEKYRFYYSLAADR